MVQKLFTLERKIETISSKGNLCDQFWVHCVHIYVFCVCVYTRVHAHTL